jgi:putative acetyltransferase
VGPLEIAPADGRSGAVRPLIEQHLEFATRWTPPEHVFALGAVDLADDPAVTLFCARLDGRPVAIGALRELDHQQAELKSMHTAVEVRRQGVGRVMVAHLLELATGRGYRRVSLETGTSDAFAPARALYASAGFEAYGPFGGYRASEHSAFMTMLLA